MQRGQQNIQLYRDAERSPEHTIIPRCSAVNRTYNYTEMQRGQQNIQLYRDAARSAEHTIPNFACFFLILDDGRSLKKGRLSVSHTTSSKSYSVELIYIEGSPPHKRRFSMVCTNQLMQFILRIIQNSNSVGNMKFIISNYVMYAEPTMLYINVLTYTYL
jgi:hypothetical protein